MHTPKVSVIIPNYNHAPFLKERIESVLNQTYTDFELILLDDCSTDSSREILLTYQSNPHVTHLVFNEQNSGGVFRQWGKGISLARGEYVWIAESDDKADPLFLEKLVEPMEANPTAAVCFSGSYLMDENDHILDKDWDSYWKDKKLKEGEVRVFDGMVYLKHSSSWYCRVYNASSAIFRKAYFSKVDPSFLTYRYCGDWYFWTEMCRFGSYIEVIRKLNYFRQSSGLRTFPAAAVRGQTYKEEMDVVVHILELIPMNWYRKNLLLGNLLRRIRREKAVGKEYLPGVYQAFEVRFGSWRIPFLLERVNKTLSNVFTKILLPQRDRL